MVGPRTTECDTENRVSTGFLELQSNEKEKSNTYDIDSRIEHTQNKHKGSWEPLVLADAPNSHTIEYYIPCVNNSLIAFIFTH